MYDPDRPFPTQYGEWVDSYLKDRVLYQRDGCHICLRNPSKTSGRLEVTRVDTTGKKRKLMVTRVLYARREGIHFEDIPRSFLAAHTCSNNMCVNPEHIFLTRRKGLAEGDQINPLVTDETDLHDVAIPIYLTGWTDIGGAAQAANVQPDDLRRALRRMNY